MTKMSRVLIYFIIGPDDDDGSVDDEDDGIGVMGAIKVLLSNLIMKLYNCLTFLL